ncbi:ATP-binding protein [Paenibacillus silviterrae]|uniref:ATP-binding protein n=1 Tax=Paenibacillus silviterrae TaxID=3242194 RepID=UPI0025439B03|nr:HAMP domain-containing sensor histidine kinase [Paenibacillus chinjuensis]
METRVYIRDALEQGKRNIVGRWLDAVDAEFPGVYDRKQLEKNGGLYFELLADAHIPLKEHPDVSFLRSLCEYHSGIGTPLVHMLHSSHIWRKCAMDEILRHDAVSIERSGRILMELNNRIDEIQRHICDIYWDFAQQGLADRDQQIQELHHDRLNLVGKMAASLAHELRNPLTSIGGFLKLIRAKLPSETDKQVNKYLDVIEHEFASFQMLITGFLSFSQKRASEEPFITVSAAELLRPVLTLIEPRLINENIELKVLEQDRILLNVQKMALQQVISNILNNSIDALLESVKPTRGIVIRFWEDEITSYIGISNNGPRIPDHIRDRLFAPFVTGKETGTGLGLTICQKIMAQNNGEISYASTEEETTFVLALRRQ